jgi:hypothetical protein
MRELTTKMIELRKQGLMPIQIFEKLSPKYPEITLQQIYMTTAPSRIARMTGDANGVVKAKRSPRNISKMLTVPAVTPSRVSLVIGNPDEIAAVIRLIA